MPGAPPRTDDGDGLRRPLLSDPETAVGPGPGSLGNGRVGGREAPSPPGPAALSAGAEAEAEASGVAAAVGAASPVDWPHEALTQAKLAAPLQVRR